MVQGAKGPEIRAILPEPDVTKELFVPACNGYLSSATVANLNDFPVARIADGVSGYIYIGFKVPDDFVSFTSLKLVWSSPAAAGNMYWAFYTCYQAAGEASDTHSEDTGRAVTASGGANIYNVQEHANPIVWANLALGDYVGVQIERNNNVLDTLNDVANIIGILFTYTGEVK